MAVREYPFSFRLPSDVRKAIEREARKQGCSLAFKINEVLRAWVNGLNGGLTTTMDDVE